MNEGFWLKGWDWKDVVLKELLLKEEAAGRNELVAKGFEGALPND